MGAPRRASLDSRAVRGYRLLLLVQSRDERFHPDIRTIVVRACDPFSSRQRGFEFLTGVR
jgi:hypothetical protein